MTYEIRFTTDPVEKWEAYRLRYDLYVKEQGLFGAQANHEQQILTDSYDETSPLLIATHKGEIVGTLRLDWSRKQHFCPKYRDEYDLDRFAPNLNDNEMLIVTRMVVRKEHRGNDLAFQLTKAAVQFSVEQGVQAIIANCEPHMLNHYIPWGFRPFGNLSNHPSNGARLRIAIIIGDRPHFENLNSPMLTALDQVQPSPKLPQLLKDLKRANRVLSQQLCDQQTYQEHILASVPSNLGFGKLLQDPTIAETLLERSLIFDCRPGEAIIYTNHASRTMYVLLSGSLNVEKDGKQINTVHEPGELIGEIAFINGVRRTAHVIASEEGAQVLALNDRTLRTLLKQQSAATAGLLMLITQAACFKLQTVHLSQPSIWTRLKMKISELWKTKGSSSQNNSNHLTPVH